MSEALYPKRRILAEAERLASVAIGREADAHARIEELERENAECRRRNEEMDREITGLRNSYWEERKAHLAAEADKARLSEALRKGREIAVDVMKALMTTGSRDNLLLADTVHKADDAARAALSGSGSGWRDLCATDGCGRRAFFWFERGGVGSHYCHDCYMRVQALPAAPQQGGE